MAHEPVHIDFDQFLADPGDAFEQIRRHGRPVVIQHDGETYRVEREFEKGTWEITDLEPARHGLHRAMGALAGVDIDGLLSDIRSARGQDSGGRPG